jgi:hypothetical protein
LREGRVGYCKINTSLHEFYEVGQSVIVNYDAQNPCKSTQPGDRNAEPAGQFALFMGVGVLILSIGLIMSIFRFVL